MKIQDIKYSERGDKVVLSARLLLNSGKTHEVYFEVDIKFKNFVARDASPFLAASLTIAMKTQENIEIDGVISKRLMASIPQIMQVFEGWKQGLQEVEVKAKVAPDAKGSIQIGCFFSGGVDSFYTYLKNKSRITHFIFVHGFDIKAKDADLYNSIEKSIAEIAVQERIQLIHVKTNIRETLDDYFGWAMAHEFALASVSLLLRRGLGEIYMSCGLTSKNASHNYLSPDLDKLWSTEAMTIRHFGCWADKVSKLKFLSKSRLAMERLRVCWTNKYGKYNCGECEKCFRNMLALYATGSLQKCKTFGKDINLNKLRNMRGDESVLKYFLAVQQTLKKNHDTSDLSLALDTCIAGNLNPSTKDRLVDGLRERIREVDNKYNHNRLFWFLSSKGVI